MRISSRALISATALASALALAGLGVAPSYADSPPSISQTATPSANVQLGHKVTVKVSISNFPAADPATTITVTDTPTGFTFWSLQVSSQFSAAKCTTPKKNQSGPITCTIAGTGMPIASADLGTLTLKASRLVPSPGNTVTITATSGTPPTTSTIASSTLPLTIHTGNGHPKTTGQPNNGQNNGQDNGNQNGQGKDNNNGHPNPGKAKGHNK